MLKKYIIGLIFILILINSCANKSVKNINPNVSETISENKQDVIIDANLNNEQLQYVNENYLTFSEIREYILNDLNIKYFIFSDFDEIKKTIKLPGDYKINMQTVRVSPHNAVFDVYTFEGSDYSLDFHKYDDSDEYFLESMTIILNQGNYLHLFPYRNIEKYNQDENFGRKYNNIFARGCIFYGTGSKWTEWEENEKEPSMVCSLNFNNGFLSSVTFDRIYD